MKHTLTDLYDRLFESLDSLKDSNYAALDANIKRAAAVRQVASTVIDAAKLEVAAHKMRKESNLDGLFPDLNLPGKTLGAGEKEGSDGKGK